MPPIITPETTTPSYALIETHINGASDPTLVRQEKPYKMVRGNLTNCLLDLLVECSGHDMN